MRILVLGIFTCFCSLLAPASAQNEDTLLACSIESTPEMDPNLVEMKFDIGDGEESFWAYVQPNITSFYKGAAPSSQVVTPKHKGLATKFINLSNKKIVVYWTHRVGQFERGQGKVGTTLGPFEARGIGNFIGFKIFFTEADKPTVALKSFDTQGPPKDNIMEYDPYLVEGDPEQTERNLATELTEEERSTYRTWRKTVDFSKEYCKVTGRAYLAIYPRPRPVHFMWPAEYFGQEHWVTTRETHFTSMPPAYDLERITSHGKSRRLESDQPRLLQAYRSEEPVLNMTLRVLSCAPRVLEIPNFLSPTEVAHILDVAGHTNLKLSTTGDSNMKQQQVHQSRSSKNSWFEREESIIVDSIYRRAADLQRMDEALMRHRIDGELADVPTTKPIVEQMQLVHYAVGQRYDAHHDFSYSLVHEEHQQTRFSTLLLYLNEGMRGGQTTFPRWANAETFEELKVVPEIGKAVLFYNLLPDGNMDDLSQHEARRLLRGEKWLINLWTWDPFNWT